MPPNRFTHQPIPLSRFDHTRDSSHRREQERAVEQRERTYQIEVRNMERAARERQAQQQRERYANAQRNFIDSISGVPPLHLDMAHTARTGTTIRDMGNSVSAGPQYRLNDQQLAALRAFEQSIATPLPRPIIEDIISTNEVILNADPLSGGTMTGRLISSAATDGVTWRMNTTNADFVTAAQPYPQYEGGFMFRDRRFGESEERYTAERMRWIDGQTSRVIPPPMPLFTSAVNLLPLTEITDMAGMTKAQLEEALAAERAAHEATRNIHTAFVATTEAFRQQAAQAATEAARRLVSMTEDRDNYKAEWRNETKRREADNASRQNARRLVGTLVQNLNKLVQNTRHDGKFSHILETDRANCPICQALEAARVAVEQVSQTSY